MKKGLVFMTGLISLSLLIPITAFADKKASNSDIIVSANEDFQELVNSVVEVKKQHPDWTEDEIVTLINDNQNIQKGVTDIWNSLTDSEKKLVIRYPFDALKVNEAKDVATSQTELKFEHNGLGDRSDAFRHGMWNAKMTLLIGKEKAELFATAHEDKDTTGIESDGYLKIEHKNMDLHNNAIGREKALLYLDASDDQLANIIYGLIEQNNSEFIWLHE